MNDSLRHTWLEAIVESEPNAVIVIDKKRIIVLANSTAAAIARVESVRDLIGKSYDEVVSGSRIYDEQGREPSPENFPSTLALTKGIATKDVIFEQVHRGEHAWLSVSATPVFDANGAPEYAIVRYVDRSLRKRREGWLSVMMQTVKVLSLTTDFETRLREKARLLVPALADWCTVNVVRADGSLARIAVVHRDPEKIHLVTRLAELSEIEMSESNPVRAVIKTGKPIFLPHLPDDVLSAQGRTPSERFELAQALGVVSTIVVPIISRGEVSGVLSVAHAESQRHFDENDLRFLEEFCFHIGVLVDNARLYEEIKTRDKAKDSFLAALSHELRNPLAPIKSSLEFLRLKSADELTGELDVVERQFDHLTKLLNDLLDVTRYTQGTIHLDKERLELNDLVRAAAESYGPFLHERSIALDVQLGTEEISLWADGVRLEQAIMNMLHNAHKFTPPGGRILIVTSRLGDSALISITDTGSGISPDELPHIFELHFQGRNKLRGQDAGLGIGLVLVKEIIQRHGGSVEARSAGPGAGSEFIVTLPLYQSAAIAQPILQ